MQGLEVVSSSLEMPCKVVTEGGRQSSHQVLRQFLDAMLLLRAGSTSGHLHHQGYVAVCSRMGLQLRGPAHAQA